MAAPGKPLLNNVIEFPGVPGQSFPTITTDGDDLHITSAGGKVYIDALLVAPQIQSISGSGGSSQSNVFKAGIFVSGATSIFSASLTISSGALTVAPTAGVTNLGSGLFLLGGASLEGNVTLTDGNLILSGNGTSGSNANVQANGRGFFGLSLNNHVDIIGSNGVPLVAADSGVNANSSLGIYSHGTGDIHLYTADGTAPQVAVTHTAASFNPLTMTGGGTPSIGTNSGDIGLVPNSTILLIGQAFSLAGTPAAFSAAEIWTIKNLAGNLRYVPVGTATW